MKDVSFMARAIIFTQQKGVQEATGLTEHSLVGLLVDCLQFVETVGNQIILECLPVGIVVDI